MIPKWFLDGSWIDLEPSPYGDRSIKNTNKRTSIKTVENNKMSCPLGVVTIDGYIGVQTWLVTEHVVVESG